MNPELEGRREEREAQTLEESEDARAEITVYALVNRHSPPF